jgi:hypothetical protein
MKIVPQRRLLNGIYKLTLIGQGTGNGVVTVKDGIFGGGDSYFYYFGEIHEELEKVSVDFEVNRHTPGKASVFGKDSLKASLSGPPASPKEFQIEGPAKAFTIVACWLADHP